MIPAPANPTVQSESELARRAAAEHHALLRRVRLFSGVAFFLFAALYASRGEWKSLGGLTCSAAVVMMNFAWLEQIVGEVLQPTPNLKAWRLTVRTLARFALFGAALTITIFIARFDAISVLLGFSVLVAGILGEAVYSTFVSFKS